MQLPQQLTSTIHREGPVPAKIMLIGEALGEQEVRYRHPFAGKAGSILDDCLAAAGLYRPHLHITNLFPFHPTDNNITPYVTFGKNGVSKSTPVYESAVERLYDEIDEVQPNVIVTLGNAPTCTLTGRTAITKIRGSILESYPVRGRTYKVIPTIHPAATEHGVYRWRHYIAIDLQRVRREAAFPEIRTPDYTIHKSPTYPEVMQYLMYCQTLPRVGSDIECVYIKDTPYTEITHWGIACSNTESMCIPFHDSTDDVFTPMQEASILTQLGRLSANPNIRMVGQYYMFDSFYVLMRYNILTRNVDDTLIAQAILYPDFNKGLDFLNSQYTNQPYYKADGKQYIKNARGSEEQFRIYNALDALTIMDIIDIQKELLRRDDMLWYYEHKCRLMEPLLFMQRRGKKVDVEMKSKLSSNALERLWELQEEIDTAVGYHINIDSPDQVKKYFYKERGAKPYTVYDKKAKKSRQTVNADALVRLDAQQGYREARLMNEFRSLRTNRSTFYNMGLDDDNRLRCSFDPVGAGSRLSSSKTIFATGMNMQNQPAKIKPCFLSDKGYWAINVDLAQAENRIVAYIWNVLSMIDAFENGKDVHSLTASGIFKKPPSEISKLKGSAVIKGITLAGGKYSERDIGKRSNHALNYGLSARQFAIKLEIPESVAKVIHSLYFHTYPEILEGHKNIRSTLRKTRILTDLVGRKREFRSEWGDDLFRAAYSYIPQSTVGNIINMWGIEEIYYNQERYPGVELLCQIHDSIEFQFPMSRGVPALAEVLIRLRESLERPLHTTNHTFTIPMDASIGFNFGDRLGDNPRGQEEIGGDWSSVWKLTDTIRNILPEAV